MDGAENQKWMELLRDYMIDNHINHTFWCLNPNSGDTGGLLGYDFTTWDDEKYGLFEPSLWQTSTTGKYISLDHAKPLGTDGSSISVSEYYATYAASEGSNLDSDGSVKPQDPITPSENPTDEPTNPKADFISGDVTDDKAINIFDSVSLKRHLISTLDEDGMPAPYASASDVTGDGVIETGDLVLLNQFLVGKDVTFKCYSE